MNLNIKKYLRVLQVARKPNKEEFTASAKICILGIILIGFIGFLIFVASKLSGI